MSCGGGLSELKRAIQPLVNQVKQAAEEKANWTFTKFVSISYKSQVVAGTNYFVKVDVGDGSYVHLRIFESLQPDQPPQLDGIQLNKTAEDEVEYFEPN